MAMVLVGYSATPNPAQAAEPVVIKLGTPHMLGLWESIQVMIMSIVGGISALVAKPLVGAILLYDLGDYLSSADITAPAGGRSSSTAGGYPGCGPTGFPPGAWPGLFSPMCSSKGARYWKT